MVLLLVVAAADAKVVGSGAVATVVEAGRAERAEPAKARADAACIGDDL